MCSHSQIGIKMPMAFPGMTSTREICSYLTIPSTMVFKVYLNFSFQECQNKVVHLYVSNYSYRVCIRHLTKEKQTKLGSGNMMKYFLITHQSTEDAGKLVIQSMVLRLQSVHVRHQVSNFCGRLQNRKRFCKLHYQEANQT